MSTFEVSVGIGSLREERIEYVDALVDTGASHSIFPRSLLTALGIAPTERLSFRLADERRREFEIGTARIMLDNRERYNTVVFGDDGMQPLLGAITLEDFALAVDPAGQRLLPAEGLLMTLLDP
jgi:clan AA aspartic protease